MADLSKDDFQDALHKELEYLLDRLGERGNTIQNRTSIDPIETQTQQLKKENLSILEKIVPSEKEYQRHLDRKIKQTREYFGELKFVSDATSAWSSVLNSSADGIKLASGVINLALKGVSTASKEAGTGLMMLGMVFKNPAVRAISIGLGLLAKAFGFGADRTQELNNLLAQETQKTIDNFRVISSSGVAFLDGMTGFRDTAFQAGLTMEEFSKVVKNNSELIAESGMGINEGSKFLANVMEQTRTRFTGVGNVTTSLREQMLNLGFGIEEQGEIVAQTMAQIRRAGGNPQDAIDVANRTAEYAKNLRIISQVTGEDAKKKMKEAQDIANDLAFNAKIREQARAKFGDDQAKINEFVSNMTQNMALLPKEVQDAVKQQVLFGTAIGDTAVALASTPQQLQDSIRNFSNGILSTEDDFKGLSSGVNDALVAFRNTPGEVARAVSTATSAGFLSGPGGILQSIFGESVKRQEDGINKATEIVNMAANTIDSMTRNLNQVSEDMRDLRMAIEGLTTDALGYYSSVLKDASSATIKLYNILSELTKPSTATTGAPNEQNLPDVTQQNTNASITARNNSVGFMSLIRVLTDLFKSENPTSEVQNRENPLPQIPGRATGGPMDRGQPTIVGEKGPELVVPAQNSMVVPNHFNLEPVIQTMKEQNRIGNEMVRYMKNMVDAQEKLVRASS